MAKLRILLNRIQFSNKKKTHSDPDRLQNGAKEMVALSATQEQCLVFKNNATLEATQRSDNPVSQHVIRFELPIDLWLLRGMSPTQYLRTYCRCDEGLSKLYKTAFDQQDKDKDKYVSLKEMEHALLLIYMLNEIHTERLYNLMNVKEDFKVDLKLFIALAGLSSRILDKEPTNDAVGPNVISGKDLLEKADFYALRWRASDVGLGGDLWILLSYLF
ncbi:uncharacterized protein LOC144606556 [Rhinoraja longicauda]